MKLKYLLTAFLALASLGTASAQELSFTKAPAFPGAEGFARYTTSGGRGGTVLHVTSLEDDGSKGTFRWACNQSGRRIIVFDVSGTIFLKSALDLRGDNVSILGQTAPGDGICIADYPFTIKAKNVILRFLRFRLGNRHVDQHEGDGLGGMDTENVIVDHCSVSWSVDECLSVYGSKNISVQWNIVDQSMVASGHSKGNHGYGGNWGGAGASYHHNLIAHHTSRTPRLGPRPGTQLDERMDLRNNVMYNWGGNGCYGGEAMHVNIVNNYYKPGPATSSNVGKRIACVNIRTTTYCERKVAADGTVTGNGWLPTWHVWGKYYVTGNYNSKYAEVTADNWGKGFVNHIDASGNDGTFTSVTRDTIKLAEPIPFGDMNTQSPQVAYEKVLKYAGASYQRDSHDAYIVNDVSTGTASHTSAGNGQGFINNQYDAGGWPTLNSKDAPLDTDGDGMPDEWEIAHGLKPTVNDANKYNLDSHRFYTNIEVYCNSLVEDIVKGGMEDSDKAFEEYYPDMENGEEPEYVSYKVWNFKSKSAETTADLTADAAWTYTSRGAYYKYAGAVDNAELTANGNVIAETKGLIFNTPSNTVTWRGAYLQLENAGASITVKGLAAKDKVCFEGASYSISPLKGYTCTNLDIEAIKPAGNTLRVYEGIVKENGDVTFTSEGNVIVGSIELKRIEGYNPIIVKTGDVNGDGTISVADLSMMAAYILGGTPDGFSETAADVNGDKSISVADLSALAAMILGQ